MGLAGPLRAARYLPSGLDVALEEMPPGLSADAGFRARLSAEGQRAAQLRDAGALHVYDLLADGSRLALAGELPGGTTLSELAAASPLPAAAVLAAVDAALAALSAAHSIGVTHGAVASQAMWVTDDGRARLGGFAVGRALHPEGDPEPVSDTAAVAAMAAGLLGVPLEPGARGSAELLRVQRVLRRGVTNDRRRRYRTAAAMRAALGAAADAAVGAGWRSEGARALAALAARAAAPETRPADAATPTAASPPRRRARTLRRALAGAALVAGAVAAGVLIGVVVAVVRGTGSHAGAGFAVDQPLLLQVDPQQGSCGTTFEVTATGTIQGSGTLVYRWERSDGLQTQDTPLAIASNTSSFRISEQLPLSGRLAQPAVTFRVVSPTPMSVTQVLPYSCP